MIHFNLDMKLLSYGTLLASTKLFMTLLKFIQIAIFNIINLCFDKLFCNHRIRFYTEISRFGNHRSSRSMGTDSKGGATTRSVPAKRPISSQMPASSRYASSVHLARSTSQAYRTPQYPYRGILISRSLLAVCGDRISHTQSGATLIQFPSGGQQMLAPPTRHIRRVAAAYGAVRSESPRLDLRAEPRWIHKRIG